MDVAIAFAAWKPFVKSKATAVATTTTSRSSESSMSRGYPGSAGHVPLLHLVHNRAGAAAT